MTRTIEQRSANAATDIRYEHDLDADAEADIQRIIAHHFANLQPPEDDAEARELITEAFDWFRHNMMNPPVARKMLDYLKRTEGQ